MESNDGVIGHEGIVRELRALALAEPPCHAILLAGPDSTGRRVLARDYARLLNCEFAAPGHATMSGFDPPAVPCGDCRHCRLIAEGRHPDVVVLAPGDVLCRPRAGDASHASHAESRDIRICQVRGAIDLVARYPFEAKHRVIVIDPADRITPDAANTLLKTLEEPPGHSVFVLVTSAPDQLLETITSRCRLIEVTTVPTTVIEDALVGRGTGPALAKSAALAARGRPGLALSFAAKPDLMGDRDRLLLRCSRIAAGALGERFRYTGELHDRWRNGDRAAIFRELEIWEEFWERDLHANAREPESAASALDALKAVALAREYLFANVLARSVFDFMLVSFPRRTLADAGAEPAIAAAS